MDSAPLAPPLDHIVSRPFSFFPAIVGIEHNEWTFQQATWSEILVVNDRSKEELWVPRRYFGEVSRTEDPVLIVGLTKELEYQSGMLRPYKQRILKMPSGPVESSSDSGASTGDEAKPFKPFRLEANDRRILRFIGIAVGCGILLYALAVTAMRVGDVRGRRVVFTTPDQAYQDLTARDDRLAIVTKLGQPGYDRFKEMGTLQFEALSYPNRKYTVLLMGPDTKSLVYIGTMDDRWKPVHSVALRNGATTESLLRSIGRF